MRCGGLLGTAVLVGWCVTLADAVQDALIPPASRVSLEVAIEEARRAMEGEDEAALDLLWACCGCAGLCKCLLLFHVRAGLCIQEGVRVGGHVHEVESKMPQHSHGGLTEGGRTCGRERRCRSQSRPVGGTAAEACPAKGGGRGGSRRRGGRYDLSRDERHGGV